MRFGERLANPFAEGTQLTLWFHPRCAAYKRAEALLQALANGGDVEERDELFAIASALLESPRATRLDGAERAKGVAACRHCREPIPRGEWRVRLSMFDEGMASPLGFVHLACASPYGETAAIAARVLHFSGGLPEADLAELRALLQAR